MLKIKSYLREMYDILNEIASAKDNITKVMAEVEGLDRKYLTGKYSHKKYVQLKNKILANRSKTQVRDLYKNYVSSLRDRLKQLNNKIVKAVYKDESYKDLKVVKTKGRIKRNLPSMYDLEIAPIVIEPSVEKPKEPKVDIPAPKVIPEKPKIETPAEVKPRKIEVPEPPHEVKPHKVEVPEVKPEKVKKPKVEKPELTPPPKFEKPKIGSDEFLDLGKPTGLFKKTFKPKKDVEVGGVLSKSFFKKLLSRKEKNVFGKTTVLPSILSYEGQVKVDQRSVGKSDILDPYLLEKQIKELKSLISRKKPEIYKASSLGYLSNISVRRLSIYFIEKYPRLFKNLYKAVRFANIRILANTYINIIFFLTIVSGLISMPLFTLFFSLQGSSAIWVISKTALSTILIINFTFWAGYYYPFTKFKARTRSINTNLPFAIDHMSSVIASGVSPSTMFKLISNSREYGEISIELEKISNYIDFFGYDILTAMRAVALTSPSTDFKEFLDGFVSTIETGGDLKQYLKQKSSEALLNYRLERQKYVESLATYSDIYTGVLIAAPLFFVTALSLVSVIGGNIAGMSVNTIMTIGTYLVIPGLNLVFLIFLEINQPEI